MAHERYEDGDPEIKGMIFGLASSALLLVGFNLSGGFKEKTGNLPTHRATLEKTCPENAETARLTNAEILEIVREANVAFVSRNTATFRPKSQINGTLEILENEEVPKEYLPAHERTLNTLKEMSLEACVDEHQGLTNESREEYLRLIPLVTNPQAIKGLE